VSIECCGNPLRNGRCGECPPKRLTFEEWARSYMLNEIPLTDHNISDREWELLFTVWKAAQENV
jgi:hypothetical protein